MTRPQRKEYGLVFFGLLALWIGIELVYSNVQARLRRHGFGLLPIQASRSPTGLKVHGAAVFTTPFWPFPLVVWPVIMGR